MATGKTLKEQLASIRNRIFAKSAVVQPVSQVTFECESGDTQSAFLTAQKEVLKWVARRAGRHLPDKAWDGQTFDLADVGSQPTAAVAIEEPRYWAVRIGDNDKEIARRTWTTEIGIGIAPSSNTLRLPALFRRAWRCAPRSGIVVRRGVHGQYANVIYQPAVWLCAVLPEKRRAARRDHGADLSRLAAVSDITGNGPRDLHHFPRSRAVAAAPGLWLTGMLDAIKAALAFSLRLSHTYELCQRERDFAMPSINYNFAALLARAETPG